MVFKGELVANPDPQKQAAFQERSRQLGMMTEVPSAVVLTARSTALADLDFGSAPGCATLYIAKYPRLQHSDHNPIPTASTALKSSAGSTATNNPNLPTLSQPLFEL